MKRLRLLIAKWALKPQNITSADILECCGFDLKKSMSDWAAEASNKVLSDAQRKAVEAAFDKMLNEKLKNQLSDLPQETIASIIQVNKLLADDKKRLITGILKSDKMYDIYG